MLPARLWLPVAGYWLIALGYIALGVEINEIKILTDIWVGM
jgi:hypothetical protein